MKKTFLLLLAFSIAPMYGFGEFTIVTSGIIIFGYGLCQYCRNTLQPQDIVLNEINTNKNEKIDDPITPSNNTPDNPHTFDPQSINNSLERYNNNIKNILDQKTQNQEPVDQPKNEPKEKPDLKEIIKPKIKTNQYTTEEYINKISDY